MGRESNQNGTGDRSKSRRGHGFWPQSTKTASNRSLLDGEFCACGCGEVAVKGAEMHAVLLKAARESLRQLKVKQKSGGDRTRKANHLLWAWHRCEEGFDSYVHGYPMWECGPPTPLWINSWRNRVDRL